MDPPLVFVSYARDDKKRATVLASAIRQGGFRTWIDVENITPGERWEVAVETGLKAADFIVVCVSSRSVTKRGFAQREIKRAIDAEQSMLEDDIFLVPVRLDGSPPPRPLLDFHWVDAPSDASFATVVEALVEGCRRRGLPIPQRDPGTPDNPPLRQKVDLSGLGEVRLFRRFLGVPRTDDE